LSGKKLVEIKNVKVYYIIDGLQVKAVDDVSFDIFDGEVLGVVGESGCGKTTLSNVLLMSIKKPLNFIDGSVTLNTQNEPLHLQKLRRDQLKRDVWGKEIVIIPQAAMNALMPTMKIKDFIYDVVSPHFKNITKDEVIKMAKERFEEIGIDKEAVNRYPFELSGGMKQRAVIATATLLNPKLLIADEPTSALDVATQKMVLKTLNELMNKKIVKSIVFITHDIATVRQIATRMMIMYAGKIAEISPIDDVLREPLHPYTEGLLLSVVTPEPEIRKRGIYTIPGSPPSLINPPVGCRFYPRCKYRMDICEVEEPKLEELKPNRFVACHYARGRV
jgi:peptide/nickel transport system ATP-binding protein